MYAFHIRSRIISNTRHVFSNKTASAFPNTQKGTADAEALVLLPADGVF